MDKLIEWLSSRPVWLKILIAVLLVGGLGVFIWFFSFKHEDKNSAETTQEVVILDVPDASNDFNEEKTSKLESYQRGEEIVSPNDYWDNLGSELGSSMNSSGNISVQNGASDPEYLDPAKYSELERYYIESGTVSKAEIDAEHERAIAEDKRYKAFLEEDKKNVLTQEQEDSIYFSRIERAYDMAQKYQKSTNESVPEKKEEINDEPEIKEPRRINVNTGESALASTTFQSDGLISSLETDIDVGENGVTKVVPARATFLKSEKIGNGQRVIMRLMQDLRLSDGTVIPANTHITGICDIGDRLNISVKTIQYNGRVYYTDMCIYDNDGIEGIYCPVVQKKKGKRAAKEMSRNVATGVAGTAASLFTGNALMGRTVSDGIRELSRVSLDDGSVVINVFSGYEFYIFENLEDFKKKNRDYNESINEQQ